LKLTRIDESTISNAAEETKRLFPADENHLHLGFCIPGILYPEKSPAQLEHEQLNHTFAVNTIGPLLIFKHFSPFLPKKSTKISLPASSITLPNHAVWLNMSARVGSTSDNKLGGWYSYRASKAAVNSATKGEDIFVRQRSGENAMVMSYHPGTVKTGLSKEFWGNVKEEKLFSPEFAVEKMVGVVGSVGLEGRGRCWDWKGEEVLP
jgi:NAD(P)-dependent dehydrogenase (short-subunit alcohol dehydrogenase family)